MAGWVRHSRVERSALTESPSQTPVDNCCFVDRLCNTDQEWTDGFWAFQTGQCAAPVQSLPQVQPQTQPGISSAIDNCCFVDRQCNTDREWTNGYWAFQKGFCTGRVQIHPNRQTETQPGFLSPAPSQTWIPTQRDNPNDINNCCYLDRECHSDEEWRAGYVAFKEQECWDSYHKWARTPIPGAVPAAGRRQLLYRSGLALPKR